MAMALSRLDDETWGERVRRARNRSRLSLKTVEHLIRPMAPASYSYVGRLEQLVAPPSDMKKRAVAFLTLVAYGYDPTEFGLSRDDLPRRITQEMLDELATNASSHTAAYLSPAA
jgi:hypothetical protein